MRPLRLVSLLVGLGVIPSLAAQTNTGQPAAQPPSVGDIREEQRIIDKAYLGDAEFQIEEARKRLGSGSNRLAQQSGLWALEQLAYAKRRLERHATKIEQAKGIFGRATESTRKELRESYATVRSNYTKLEDRLENVAEALKRAGLSILAETLVNVRSSTGEAAVKAVNEGLRKAGERGKGEKDGDQPPGADNKTVQLGNGAGTATLNSDGSITIGNTTIPGSYNPVTQSITTPQFGTVDLKTAQANNNGVTFLLTSEGVLIIPPGILIKGAKLNPDGTIRFGDGTTASINEISVGGDGKINVTRPGKAPLAFNPATGMPATGGGDGGGAPNYSGPVPMNQRLVGANGQPITVDGDAPPFQNGERSFVRKTYLGARDTILQREAKITQRLLEVSSAAWRVDESLGETRNWALKLSDKLRDTRSESGKFTGTTAVETGGTGNVTISSFDAQDDSGQKPLIQKGSAPNTYTLTCSKSGDYTIVAEGATDWGSRFRLETTYPIGVR